MFLQALNIDPRDRKALQSVARSTGISVARLRALDAKGLEPKPVEMQALASFLNLSETAFRLRTGLLNRSLRRLLAASASDIERLLASDQTRVDVAEKRKLPAPSLTTEYGSLYQGDCLEIMRCLPDESCDLIFADPPFNLDKLYPSAMDDNLRQEHYLEWCETWLDECARLLREGGALFVYNLPKWNTFLGAHLNKHLTFRHWITVDIKSSLPIAGRLYPSHYALLYYIKGERPNAFHPDRMPMEICPSCMADLKDYGGYKDKMNPLGVSLTDVWYDIPPVRHAKYKKRKTANELSIKLLDRVIELASNEGDTVLDPFGGSGTTYAVAEMKQRKWIGIEIGPVEGIVERMENVEGERSHLERIRTEYNNLFQPKHAQAREAKGLWTVSTYHDPD